MRCVSRAFPTSAAIYVKCSALTVKKGTDLNRCLQRTERDIYICYVQTVRRKIDVHNDIYMWELESLDSDLKLIEPSEKVSLRHLWLINQDLREILTV